MDLKSSKMMFWEVKARRRRKKIGAFLGILGSKICSREKPPLVFGRFLTRGGFLPRNSIDNLTEAGSRAEEIIQWTNTPQRTPDMRKVMSDLTNQHTPMTV